MYKYTDFDYMGCASVWCLIVFVHIGACLCVSTVDVKMFLHSIRTTGAHLKKNEQQAKIEQ